MGLADIAPIIENDHRVQVMHLTWGHLFPEKNAIFQGSIQIAETDYGDLVVIKDNSNVPSSPWWFASLMKFTEDFLAQQDQPGVIFEIQTQCSVIKKENGQMIDIKSTKSKIIA